MLSSVLASFPPVVTSFSGSCCPVAQTGAAPGSHLARSADPEEQELLFPESSNPSLITNASRGCQQVCYQHWTGLGHASISGAKGRNQHSPKHCSPIVEGVMPQRKIRGLLLEEEGVEAGQSKQHPLLIEQIRLLHTSVQDLTVQSHFHSSPCFLLLGIHL